MSELASSADAVHSDVEWLTHSQEAENVHSSADDAAGLERQIKLTDSLVADCGESWLQQQDISYSIIMTNSVTAIIFSKSKLWYFLKCERSKSRYFPCGDDFFSMIFNAFYKQCLNCVLSVDTISIAHYYVIIVTNTLRLSKKKIIMCFSD